MSEKAPRGSNSEGKVEKHRFEALSLRADKHLRWGERG